MTRGKDADGEKHPATTKVAHEVDWRHWRLTAATDHRQCAGQCNVVDVMTGPGCQRAILSPAGHSPIDETLVAGEALIGPDTQPLGDPWTHTLDEHVGRFDHLHDRRDAVRVFEVDTDRLPTSIQQIGRRCSRIAASDSAGAIDSDDFGTEIGEHHRAERTRADRRQLDNSDSIQGPCHVLALVLVGPCGEGGDRLHDLRPLGHRKVVAHPFDFEIVAVLDQFGGTATPTHIDERVLAAVNDKARNRDRLELLVAIAREVNSAVLPQPPPSGCDLSQLSPEKLAHSDSSHVSFVPHTRLPATPMRSASSRVVAGVTKSAAMASGLGCPTSGFPVVDASDVIVATMSGRSAARTWAIIPPIDIPRHEPGQYRSVR